MRWRGPMPLSPITPKRRAAPAPPRSSGRFCARWKALTGWTSSLPKRMRTRAARAINALIDEACAQAAWQLGCFYKPWRAALPFGHEVCGGRGGQFLFRRGGDAHLPRACCKHRRAAERAHHLRQCAVLRGGRGRASAPRWKRRSAQPSARRPPGQKAHTTAAPQQRALRRRWSNGPKAPPLAGRKPFTTPPARRNRHELGRDCIRPLHAVGAPEAGASTASAAGAE